MEIVNKKLEKQKVILLNGPPNSGKDVSALILKDLFAEGEHRAFKDVLYEETAKYFNVDLEWLTSMATDRTTKEAPTRELFDRTLNPLIRFALFLFSFVRPVGFSPRQALIHVSENIIKPRFGDTYFGKKLLSAIQASGANYTFVSDSGFLKELIPLVDAELDITVIRLYRDGCDYLGDSRRYLEDEELKDLGIRVIDVKNDGTIADLREKLLSASLQVLGV
ncbi:hypothetical protein vBAbaMD22_96 [Acinetobacter phage vB_AbaM_D22]|nr:hypothetical protein vBAbaMD22_96 [Acinetobacter phage vB_AbaM_D22]